MRESMPVAFMRYLGQHRLIPRPVWRRLPVAADIVIRVNGMDSFQYRAIPDHAVDRALFWRGLAEWEAESLQVWAGLARQSRTICDVGANTGIYTLIAAAVNSDAEVLSFEPVPRVYDRLVANIKSNGWSERCRAFPVAVAERSGTGCLSVPRAQTPKSARLIDVGSHNQTADELTVTTVRLDDVPEVRSARAPLDLVKIDVEGHEDRVLEGMAHQLASSRPCILLECLPEGPNRAIGDLLRSHGYRFEHLLPTGPQSIDRIVPDPARRYRNYLARP